MLSIAVRRCASLSLNCVSTPRRAPISARNTPVVVAANPRINTGTASNQIIRSRPMAIALIHFSAG
jgi:hypothetical protein